MATLYILYGSATGNAEGIAKDLAERTLPKTFSNAICQPLESFKKLSKEWETEPKAQEQQKIKKQHAFSIRCPACVRFSLIFACRLYFQSACPMRVDSIS